MESEQSPDELFPLVEEQLRSNYGAAQDAADGDQPAVPSSGVWQWKVVTSFFGLAALGLAAFALASPSRLDVFNLTASGLAPASTGPSNEELFSAAETWKAEKLRSNYKTIATLAGGGPVVIEVLNSLILGRGLNGVNLYTIQVGVEGLQYMQAGDSSPPTTNNNLRPVESTPLADSVPPRSLYRGNPTGFDAWAAKYRAIVAMEAAPLTVKPNNISQIKNMLLGSDAGTWETALTYGGSYFLEQKAVVYSPPYWPLPVGDFVQNVDTYPKATDVYRAQSVATAAYDAPIFQAVIESVIAKDDDDPSVDYPKNMKFKAVARFCNPDDGSHACVSGTVFAPQVDFVLGEGDHTKVVSYESLVPEIMSGENYTFARASGQLLGCYHLTLFNDSSLQKLYGNKNIAEWKNCSAGTKCDTVIIGDGGCASSAIRHLLMGRDGGLDEFLPNFDMYDGTNRSVGKLTIVGSSNDTTIAPTDGSQNGIGFAEVINKFRNSENNMDELVLNCGYEAKMFITDGKKIKVCFKGTNNIKPTCKLTIDPEVGGLPCIIADRVIYATTDTRSTTADKTPSPNPKDTVLYRDPVWVHNLSFQVGGEVNLSDTDFSPNDDVPNKEYSTVGFKDKNVSDARFWGLVVPQNMKNVSSPLNTAALLERYRLGEFLGDSSFAPLHVPVMAQMSLYHHFLANGVQPVVPRPNLNADYESVIKHYAHRQLNIAETNWVQFLNNMRDKKKRPHGSGMTQKDIIQAWDLAN